MGSTKMISWSDSKCQATETQDEVVQNTPYIWSVGQLSDAVHMDDNDRLIGTCMLCMEEPCSCFHDQDYVEKIKEFQFYVDMVKKIARPGCSPEMLNVALSSMSSLVKTLTVISSKQYMHAAL